MAADPAAASPVPSVWTAVGPSVMLNGQAFTRPAVSGRVPSLALSRYADVVYAATSNGGVWRSDDGGLAWRALMDPRDEDPTTLNGRADSLACGAVAIHPDHPERVFVGTGEAFGALDSFLGVGPLVSQDGGRNWGHEDVVGTALTGRGFFALAVDPSDPQRVAGATRAGLYLRRPKLGGGFEWAQQVLTGVAGSPVRSISSVVCTRGVFFAAVRDGGAGRPSVVLRSNDHGATWRVVGTGFPAAAGRITLAVHPDRTDTVYAVTQNGRLLRLRTDAAGNGAWRNVAWTPVPAQAGVFVGTQGWYDLALTVDPSDVDTVFCGGSTLKVTIAGQPRGAGSATTDIWSSHIWRVRVRRVGGALTAQPLYIGATIHADVHALAFPRGLPGQLWVGCDGGVFHTDTAQAPAPVFRSLNSGLATALINDLALHPTQPAVIFAATQDNGGQRAIGDEAWQLTTEGDAGAAVVDWNDPYRVLMTYTKRTVKRCTDGGNGPTSWHNVSVPALAGDKVLFYAPLAIAPPSATAAHASRVAFGTQRLWLSDNLGSPNLPPAATDPGDWAPLPTAGTAALPNEISAIAFSAFDIVYAGTVGGGVYRYVQAVNPGPWVRTQIDTVGAMLPLAAPITDIEPDPADASGNSIYVTLGGNGDRRHVWHFDNANWTDRSGPVGPTGLLDVQASAIVCDPDNTTHLYLATDVGVWRSLDSGATWRPWGEGLPEAAAVDIVIHRPSRLIRVATHGRGSFMRLLGAPGAAAPVTMAPVQLLVREHYLDLGLGPAVHGLPDPTQRGVMLAPGVSPDVRCDAPDAQGAYRFSADHQPTLVDFLALSQDDSAHVPTAQQPLVTRVQVLVHNNGARWAHDVQVAVLIAEGRHGALPPLPAGWAAQLRRGQPVAAGGWRTVGFSTVSDLRPGHPQVATVALPSTLLPAPGALVGHAAHTLFIAVHHADDPLLSDESDASAAADALRQVALRHITVEALVPVAASGPTVSPGRFLPIGPAPMLNGLAQGGPPVAGRTPGVAVSRHGEIVYIGTANGGVWRSGDAGQSWRSCMEALDLDPAALQSTTLACPAVAIHPDHPERVFVGTGEPFNNLDAYFGVGMLVSLDSGRNWLREATVATGPVLAPTVIPPAAALQAGAVLQGAGCYGVVVDPGSPERALAATSAGAFLREPDGEGGFRWRRMWLATAVAGGTDPTFIAGQPVFMPLAPLPGAAMAGARCTIATKEDDPSVLYLIRRDGAAFRWDAGPARWGTVGPMPSDLQGHTWIGTQGWYDLALAVDPGNVNAIALGGSTVKADADVLAPGTGGNWFSSIWACTVVPNGTNWTLAATYIGARAHADVHRLVFTPGDRSQLWTGNDGGLFRCDGWDQPGARFVALNRGLNTLSGNSVDSHPTEPALLLLSTQDNGAALGLGTPGWRMVLQGDSGSAVWHWGDVLNGVAPRVIISYTNCELYRYAASGTGPVRRIDVNDASGNFRFYSPMVGSPPETSLALAARADRVAIGGTRLWLTDAFGGAPAPNLGDWASLPANAPADALPAGQIITSLLFLAHDRIVAGTTRGECFLYERNGGVWRGPQRLAQGAWPLPVPAAATGLPAPTVTGLCRDPAGSATTFYACVGGTAARRRVWRCGFTLDGAGNVTATTWTLRAGDATHRLLDINHNAIATVAGDLYVAADIGLWRSTDLGATWNPASDGLPDAPLLDLEALPGNTLRVSTHGRGTYERQLPPGPVPRVRLLVRDTLLDRGLVATTYAGRRDHLGNAVAVAASPDIVVDAPVAGAYQSSPNLGLNHVGFAALADRSAQVATHASGVLNRVHVQVQNTGAEACSGAIVLLLLAEAAAGSPPPLPADFAGALRAGLPIAGGGWTTVGLRRLGPLDAREPVIASFDLHSTLLPTPAALAGHASWFLLALVSHEFDPFADVALPVQALGDAQRQAALRAITVVPLAGDPPVDQLPPRALPTALPLAVAMACDRRLTDMLRDADIRGVSGDALRDVDRALQALLRGAQRHLRGGAPLLAAGPGATISRMAALGAMGFDLPEWADYLEPGPGWLRDALRRGSADADVSVTVADALTVISRTAQFALADAEIAGNADRMQEVRAFCAGLACGVATDWIIGPVLRGAAAARGPADTPSVDRMIAETWVSRVLLDRVPETDAFLEWVPDEMPAALRRAFVKAVREVATDAMRALRLDTTPDHAPTLSEDEFDEGYGLMTKVLHQQHWGMGIWFLVLAPVFLAPSLGVLFARLGDHSGRLLKISDDSKGPDEPENDSDEKSWFQAANFLLGAGAPMPFAYGLALWAMVPRRDADFVQFTVAGGLRVVFTAVAAATMSANAGIRWGVLFTPWIATDLYFLARSIAHYAKGRPGSGLMYLMQTLPLMGLAIGWLFCLLIRKANLRSNGAFWGLWALFTGLLMGGAAFMAWRLSAGGGLIAMLRDRRDPVLTLDAFSGADLRLLPPARALVYPDHQLWQQSAGLAGQRFPAGMRPLLKLWHGDAGWQIRPAAGQVEFRQNAGVPITVALPKVQDAAALLVQLQGAVAGLQGSVVAPAGFELPWPVRLADHGDDQPTWALHDQRALDWRDLPRSEGDAYRLRHAPRSRTGAQVGAPGAAWSPAEGPLKPVPGFDSVDPLGTDLDGTALGLAGNLAAVFQMALAPVFDPTIRANAVNLTAGREVLRRWNLDERREAEWRLLVGLDAGPEIEADRFAPGAGATSDGTAIARTGVLPAFDAWRRVLRDDRIDLSQDISSAAMPLIRPRGEAPRQATHAELSATLKAMFNLP
ncbi:MAG: hypothetical protein EOP35_03775 [Rubrivivax sp.]|nr:MAG: hypothetical protein EOP35_03775 [Rubrivivax sp.]